MAPSWFYWSYGCGKPHYSDYSWLRKPEEGHVVIDDMIAHKSLRSENCHGVSTVFAVSTHVGPGEFAFPLMSLLSMSESEINLKVNQLLKH